MTNGDSAQIRAIWLDDDGPLEQVDVMLDRVVQGGFNTLFYYVGAGMVYYDSALLPRSPRVTPEQDPLAYVLERAHARGLRVQAWWCPGVVPKNSAFRARYPEWDIAMVEGIPKDFHWLNFSLPEVRQFVGDVVMEIAENYDVDGVHLDYIRYPSPPPHNEVDCRVFFSPDDVSATVQNAYQRLGFAKPSVRLTAAVLAGWKAPENAMQDWTDWLAGGYIDYVLPMAYCTPDENDVLQRYIGEWLTKPNTDRIIPGLSIIHGTSDKMDQPKTPEQLLGQIGTCQAAGFGDFAIFAEAVITDKILDKLAVMYGNDGNG